MFDFGIARAVKRGRQRARGSTTLFDPGTLGALTPTYASCEMIEGLEPDSRDDVYAIACVVVRAADRQASVQAHVIRDGAPEWGRRGAPTRVVMASLVRFTQGARVSA